ncbi:MAG TPA: MATE family efflux transporter, partial [Oribacterium sp.]|nr:MATE family efflux transporter [Oribacterium sp.]
MSERVQEEKHSLMKDMTSGNPTALILGFAIPMLLGTLFQQFYSMVDTIIVGRLLGVDALAGVGSTGAVNFMINGFVIGTCSGFAIPVAQRFGAQDFSGLRRYVANIIWLTLGLAAVITVIIGFLT